MMGTRAKKGGLAMRNAEHPIDLDHLNRYTGGDTALNQEILQLFDNHCRETVTKLEELARKEDIGGQSWRELTHTLKGSARGVGAFALADVAAEAEKLSTDKLAAIEAVHRLKSKSCAVQLFVDELLRHEG
jgi:hypothetical protein